MESSRAIIHKIISEFANEDPYWFTLFEGSSQSFTNLPKLLGFHLEDFKSLLVLAKFGYRGKNGEFKFRQDAMMNFVRASLDLSNSTEVSKFQFNKKTIQFILLGKKKAGESVPSPLNQGRWRNSKLSKSIFVLTNMAIQNVLKQNGMQRSITASVIQEEEKEDTPNADGEHQTEKSWLCELIEKTLLTFVLTSTEGLQWNRFASTKAIEEALHSLMGEILDAKERRLTSILGSQTNNPSPQTSNARKEKYPTLFRYNISLTERRVHDNIIKELFKLSSYLQGKEAVKTRGFMVDLGNNDTTCLVPVPRSKNVERMIANDRKYQWFKQIIQALGGEKEETDASITLTNFLLFIGSKPANRNSFLSATEQLGLTIHPRIDAATSFAVQSSANLSYMQMRELRRGLKVAIGSPVFAPEFKIKSLGANFVEPIVDSTTFNGRMIVHWSARKVDVLLAHYLQQVMLQLYEAGDNVSVPSLKTLFHCDVVTIVDHGKGYSRATLVVILRYRLWNGQVLEDKQIFSLASAKCRKDSYEIIAGTYGKTVNDSMNCLAKHNTVYVYMSIDNVLYVSYVDDYNQPVNVPERRPKLLTTLKVEQWLAGDLLFFAMTVSKEGSSSHWCHYCDCSKGEWQAKDHNKGTPWTLARIAEHKEKLRRKELDEKKPNERMGVKQIPFLFTAVDIDHFVLTVLHLQIGLVNQVFDNLIEQTQAACEQYTAEYFAAERDLYLAKAHLEECMEDCRVFETEHAAQERLLKRELRSSLTPEEEKEEISFDLDLIRAERLLLEDIKTKAKDLKERAECSFKREASKPVNSKAEGQPVRAGIEAIAKKHGIERAAFHGGDMQGPGCRKLMCKAGEIMSEVQGFLLSLPPEQKKVDDEHIVECLSIHEKILTHLDGLFSVLRRKRFHLENNDLEDAAKHKEHVLSLWRNGLGRAITPKMHILEDHALDLVQAADGLGDLGEDAGELAHQIQSRHVKRVESVKKLKIKEESIIQHEAIGMNKSVRHARLTIQKQSTRVFRKRSGSAQDTANNKHQKRVNARKAVLQDSMLETKLETLKEKKLAKLN